MASMGIYVFKRKYLEDRLEEDAREPNSVHDFGYAILPVSVKRDRVFGFEFSGYWRDIGTVEAYYEANMQLLKGESDFAVSDLNPVLTGDEGRISSCAFDLSARVVNSLISPGCEIEGYVENSILSPGVRVARRARVSNSIVMANTSIGYQSVVERCVLDEGVDIGQFCYLGFGITRVPRISDITLVGKDVNLAPQTAVGSRSKILPGLKLGALSHRFVAPGTVVSVPG